MTWLRENAFWIVVGILFMGLHMRMHGGHGHGGHGRGGHGHDGHGHAGGVDSGHGSSEHAAEGRDRPDRRARHAGH